MPNEWNGNRKRSVSLLYKTGKKMISKSSQVAYLTKCLEKNIIPKSFKIRGEFPGNKQFIKIITDHLSKELIVEESSKGGCNINVSSQLRAFKKV